MLDYAPAEAAGGVVAQVGQGVVTDPERKTAHQVGIVAFGNDPAGQRVLLAIGEATWAETLGAGHLARLQRVRELPLACVRHFVLRLAHGGDHHDPD